MIITKKISQTTKVLEYFWRDYDEWEYKGFPTLNPSKTELAHFSESVIWVGHSTVMMNHNGVTILTDPHFTKRAGPFGFMGPKRITPPPFLIEDLPKIDIIIISHNHYDHLDKQSIIRLTSYNLKLSFCSARFVSILKSFGVKDILNSTGGSPLSIKILLFRQHRFSIGREDHFMTEIGLCGQAG